MAHLVVLSFTSLDDARALWRRHDLPDAVLVWREPDGTVRVEPTSVGPADDWNTVVGTLFLVAVPAGTLLRRPGEAGLTDALVRRTAGSLAPGTAAVVALLRHGLGSFVRLAARRHHGRVLSATLTPGAEARLVRTLSP